MPARVDVPAELLRRPFTVAEARQLGLTSDVLRPPRFLSPHRGVRVPAALEPGFAVDAVAASLALPPTALLSEWTAVRLHGLPTPWGRPDPVGRVVQARVPEGVARSEVAGVSCGRLRSGDQLVRLSVRALAPLLPPGARLRVQDAVSAWCDLAPGLPFVDAVALGDAVRRHHATQEQLVAAVEARVGRRGAQQLRTVLAAVRHQVDSAMETEVRLLLVGAGLPEPQCGRWVADAVGRLWQVDLLWAEQLVIVEYDGDVHRQKGKAQWRHDEQKRAALREAGYAVVVLVASDVPRHRRLAREDTVERVRRALAGG